MEVARNKMFSHVAIQQLAAKRYRNLSDSLTTYHFELAQLNHLFKNNASNTQLEEQRKP